MYLRFIFSTLILVCVLMTIPLHGQFLTEITGEGPKITQTLNLPYFNAIGLAIDAKVYLKQGDVPSVRVEAQKNIIENLKTEVEKGALTIDFHKNVRRHADITFWITVKELSNLAVAGSGNIRSENQFNVPGRLQLAISGSGDIYLDAIAGELNSAISGSGSMVLKGSTDRFQASISGSGKIDAKHFSSDECKVNIAGSGDAYVNANASLDVNIVGSGYVYFTGEAKVISKIIGSGDIVRR